MRRVIITLVFVVSLLFGISFSAAYAPATAYAQSASGAAAGSGPQLLLQKAKSSWPWYMTRAAGMTAAILLLVLVVFGIGLVTGFTYRFMEPITAWAVHRALAISFGVCVVVHIVSLLFDKYVGFNLLQVLVPFTSHYDPVAIAGFQVGSFWTACGIVAFYLAGITILTSLLIMERRPSQWQLLHYLNYVLVSLVFVHGLFMGSDLLHGTLRNIWIFFGVLILAAMIMRLRRARTISR